MLETIKAIILKQLRQQCIREILGLDKNSSIKLFLYMRKKTDCEDVAFSI